jgi:hypothetical protein
MLESSAMTRRGALENFDVISLAVRVYFASRLGAPILLEENIHESFMLM